MATIKIPQPLAETHTNEVSEASEARTHTNEVSEASEAPKSPYANAETHTNEVSEASKPSSGGRA